jgi:hypothetical protein
MDRLPVPGHLCSRRHVNCAGARAVEDVTCLNGHIAEIVVASRFVLFPDIPMASLMSRVRSLHAPGAHPSGGATCASSTLSVAKVWTRGPTDRHRRRAAQVQDDGYSTSMDQISRRDWWTPSTRRRWTHLDRVWASALGRRALDAQGVRMEVACELDVVGVPW